MFVRKSNIQHTLQFGKEGRQGIGKVGLVPTFKPIGYPNPSPAQKESTASIQRSKR